MNYILSLGLLLLFALLSNRIMKLFKMPAVTGYLIVGLIIAIFTILIDSIHTGTNLTETLNSFNTLISSIALGFIALSIGEEFKISKIKKYGKNIILITFLQAFAAVFFVDIALLILCLILKLNLSIALCLGAIATATAPAATIMVINQYKAKGPMVDLLLPVVAFDDAIGLVVFAVSVSFAKLIAIGGNVSIISILLVPLINIFGSLIFGFILGLIMHFIMPYFKSRNNHEVVFISFTLVGVGLCDLFNTFNIAGEYLELSNLLCCMMIGATYTNIVKKKDVDVMYRDFELVDRWTPFLFMLFFVLSGSHLVIAMKEMIESNSISFLLPVLLVFVIYLLFRSLGKYYGCKLGCVITKQDKRTTNNLGITLLPQAGVAIGMANQISRMDAFKTNSIGNIIVTCVLCATLVYELVGPLLTKQALNRVGEIPNSDGIYPFEEELKRSQNIYFK